MARTPTIPDAEALIDVFRRTDVYARATRPERSELEGYLRDLFGASGLGRANGRPSRSSDPSGTTAAQQP